MKDLSQFITDHPLFVFGLFLLLWVGIDYIGTALISLARRK